LQLTRIARAVAPVQVHDRSPACTVALARQLKHREPAIDMSPFEKTVFFVRNLGRIENTEARRISFADALVFEKIHEDVYRARGFDLVEIAPAPVEARADIVERYLRLAGGM
jgi:predicted ATPase